MNGRVNVVLLLVLAAAPLGAQTPPHWRVEQELRIGSVDGPHALTLVGNVIVAIEGSILIAQPAESLIRVFGPDGRFVQQIGRNGRGPGEFERLSSIGWLADTLYAVDQGLRRVTFFRPVNQVVRTVALQSPMIDSAYPPRYMPASPRHFFRDGTALVYPSIAVRSIDNGDVTRYPLLRINRDGRLLDTLHWQPMPRRAIAIKHNGRDYYSADPFPQEPLVTELGTGEGIVVAEVAVSERPPHRFRVIRIGPGGDTVSIREHAYQPVSVSDALLDFLAGQAHARMESAQRRRGNTDVPGQRAIRQALESGGYVPRTLPPVTAIMSGVDGSIWLRREITQEPLARWLVLDAGGSPLATVDLPREARVLWADDRRVITSEPDELDVPFVVRYRLVR